MNSDYELMSKLLSRAKMLAPSRTPHSDPQLCKAWADTLVLGRFPARLWGEAVESWALDPEGGFFDVGVLRRCAYRVRDRWEGDAVLRKQLEARRVEFLRWKESQGLLPAGTAPPIELETAQKQALDPIRRDEIRKMIHSIGKRF